MTPDLSKEPCSNNTYSWFPDGHTLSHSHAQIPPQHSIYWLTAYCYFRHVTPPNSCRLLRFRCVVVFQPPSRQINRKADGLERSSPSLERNCVSEEVRWHYAWIQQLSVCEYCISHLHSGQTQIDRRNAPWAQTVVANRPIYRRFIHSPQSVVFSSQTSLSRPHCWT